MRSAFVTIATLARGCAVPSISVAPRYTTVLGAGVPIAPAMPTKSRETKEAAKAEEAEEAAKAGDAEGNG